MYDGNIIGQEDEINLEKILFKKYIYPITQKQFKDRFNLKETMLTSKELEGVLKMTEEQAKSKYGFNKKEFFSARYEYWNRKNGALICLVFCFLAFTLGITGNRGKTKNAGLTGLLCLIVYYVLYFSLVSVAKNQIVPVPVAVFIPATILFFIGIKFYRNLDWQS